MKESEKYLMSIVDYLNDFFGVLSDGYNPAVFWLSIDSEIETKPADKISEHWLGKNTLDKILKTKRELTLDLKSLLDHYFDWSLEHLRLNTNAKELFSNEHNTENLTELINKVKNEIINYFKDWDFTITEYTIDSIDGSIVKEIFMNSKNGNVNIGFGNYIH